MYTLYGTTDYRNVTVGVSAIAISMYKTYPNTATLSTGFDLFNKSISLEI